MKKIVLIFEKDDAIRLVLKRMVEAEGYLVFVADTWEEAFEKIELIHTRPEPFVILADISHPGDGTRLIDKLKEKDLASIPVIPMSTGKEVECHGKKVLKKPIVLDDLITLIGKHFGNQNNAA